MNKASKTGKAWDDEAPLIDYGIDVPEWIEQDISTNDVDSINKGGCSSGAYMPAVTYYKANATMAEHGDDVLSYLEESECGSLPRIDGESWSGFASKVLSRAVEVWASTVEGDIRQAMEAEAEAEAGGR